MHSLFKKLNGSSSLNQRQMIKVIHLYFLSSEEELPVKVTPVEMYVPKSPPARSPPPTSVDGKYVAQHLGTALTLALAEIAEKRPRDPIEYLGEWLYKYRQTLDENNQVIFICLFFMFCFQR